MNLDLQNDCILAVGPYYAFESYQQMISDSLFKPYFLFYSIYLVRTVEGIVSGSVSLGSYMTTL